MEGQADVPDELEAWSATNCNKRNTAIQLGVGTASSNTVSCISNGRGNEPGQSDSTCQGSCIHSNQRRIRKRATSFSPEECSCCWPPHSQGPSPVATRPGRGERSTLRSLRRPMGCPPHPQGVVGRGRDGWSWSCLRISIPEHNQWHQQQPQQECLSTVGCEPVERGLLPLFH